MITYALMKDFVYYLRVKKSNTKSRIYTKFYNRINANLNSLT